jgi:hypothetical protein
MKSIKTSPNSAKGPDKGKIVNKLYCILLTTLEFPWLYFFLETDMKFIILVSNLKEISPSVFCWKKEYIQNYYTIRPKKDTKLCLCVEKWSRSVSHLFFNFYTKLAESSFLCHFRVESVNVFLCAMCFFFNKPFRTCANALPNEFTV